MLSSLDSRLSCQTASHILTSINDQFGPFGQVLNSFLSFIVGLFTVILSQTLKKLKQFKEVVPKNSFDLFQFSSVQSLSCV